MSVIFWPLTISLIAGLSTLVGGFLVFGFKVKSLKGLSVGFGASAGIMIYLSFFELLPEALNLFNDKLVILLSFLFGLFVAYVLDIATHFWLDGKSTHHEDNLLLLSDTDQARCSLLSSKKMMTTGFFTACAIALHNFPEGIVTFFTASYDLVLGLTLMVAIIIHNIPEGFCVALPVYCATGSRRRGLFYAFISGLAEPLGGLIAFLILFPFLSPFILSLILSATAGLMVYVSVDELIPWSRRLGNGHWGILGLMAGLFLMSLLMFFLNQI